MSVKLLTEHHLESLSLKGGFTGWSESKLVKTPHCWKSRVTAQLCSIQFIISANISSSETCVALSLSPLCTTSIKLS